jgi:hypothetical protein
MNGIRKFYLDQASELPNMTEQITRLKLEKGLVTPGSSSRGPGETGNALAKPKNLFRRLAVTDNIFNSNTLDHFIFYFLHSVIILIRFGLLYFSASVLPFIFASSSNLKQKNNLRIRYRN